MSIYLKLIARKTNKLEQAMLTTEHRENNAKNLITGDYYILHGLTNPKYSSYNEEYARVLNYNEERARYVVLMPNGNKLFLRQ